MKNRFEDENENDPPSLRYGAARDEEDWKAGEHL